MCLHWCHYLLRPSCSYSCWNIGWQHFFPSLVIIVYPLWPLHITPMPCRSSASILCRVFCHLSVGLFPPSGIQFIADVIKYANKLIVQLQMKSLLLLLSICAVLLCSNSTFTHNCVPLTDSYPLNLSRLHLGSCVSIMRTADGNLHYYLDGTDQGVACNNVPSGHLSYIHTHAHPFNGPFSGTTQVSRYQKGKTNLDFTEARDSEWQWHQLGHMQVCTSLLTDNHASTPPLCFLQAGCPSCRPTNSVKALKEHCLTYSF